MLKLSLLETRNVSFQAFIFFKQVVLIERIFHYNINNEEKGKAHRPQQIMQRKVTYTVDYRAIRTNDDKSRFQTKSIGCSLNQNK